MAIHKYYGSEELGRALSMVCSYLKNLGDENLDLPKIWDASYIMTDSTQNASLVKLRYSSFPLGGESLLLALCYETCLSNCKNESLLKVDNLPKIVKWIEDLSPSETETICRELHRSNDMSFQPNSFR